MNRVCCAIEKENQRQSEYAWMSGASKHLTHLFNAEVDVPSFGTAVFIHEEWVCKHQQSGRVHWGRCKIRSN